MKFTPTFNLETEYKKYQNVLKNAKQGEVVTRFAPEPSGYLHIGHVKAALITYHYAKIYKGKMLLRFDDTNPSKEKTEYVESIQEDLQKLGISWDKMSYTSDHFDYFEKEAIKLIEQDLAYCDNTPVDDMREQRDQGIESKCRNQSVEENLRIFKGMKTALHPDVLAKKIEEKKKPAKFESKSKDGKKKPEKEIDLTDYSQYCLRAKISMDNKNKCMRDPVLYRCNFTAHHRTGTKYKIYPTYDFACPLIDSLEGVTHAMRSMEYTDRVAQYNWVIKKTGVRPVNIFEFSRLGFVNVVLSKRKLQWFVDTGRVESWGDARMPTVRGILRRGLRVETLTEFMLGQGPSRKYTLMEWDKIWSMNKKIIDPVCPRYTCIRKEKACNLTIENGPSEVFYNVAPMNPIKESVPELKANRPVAISKNLLIDFDDANNIKEGEKITLMKYGNVIIKSKKQVGDSFELVGEFQQGDKDFKKTQKINFLSKDQDLVNVNLIEFDHLINVDKVEEDQDFETVVNENTRFVNSFYADPLLRNHKVQDVLQFERRGYYKIDNVKLTKTGDKNIDLIFVPDGKQKAMTSTITHAVDAKTLTQGKQGENKAEAKKAKKEAQKQQAKAENTKKADAKAKGPAKASKGGKDASSGLTLTTVQGNFRGNTILIASEIGFQPVTLDLIPWQELKSKETIAKNPQGQVPFLNTKDGYIYQTAACLRYIAGRNPNSGLLGKTEFQKAQVDQWVDFANYELGPVLFPILRSIWGWTAEDLSGQIPENVKKAETQLNFLDQNLKGKKLIVGDKITIADIILHSFLVYPFRTSFSAEWRAAHPNLTAWFESVSEHKNVLKYYGKNRYPAQTWF